MGERKMSLQPLVSGFVSQRVVILTVEEYNARMNDAWLAGVERGRFEERCPPQPVDERDEP